MATKTTQKQNKVKQKKQFNIYTAMHKNKKKFVMVVCSVLVVTLIAGVFAQFAFI